MDWRHSAVCAQVDPEPWTREYLAETRESRMAKAICQTCPVKAACLRDALDRNDEHGIWGGTSPGDRKRIRREMHRAVSV